jgi:riboflavin-specific deaminase-like protein
MTRKSSAVLFLLCLALLVSFDSKGWAECAESPPSDPSSLTIHSIVNDIQSWQKKHEEKKSDFPFVTVTYAQSIDGRIALQNRGTDRSETTTKSENAPSTSSNFGLSDPQSLRMTHGLRSIHDAILVGGRTILVDNPRLNNRLWHKEAGNLKAEQPRPVVLDTHLRYMSKMWESCNAQNIIVCCSDAAASAAKEAKILGLPPSLDLLPCPLNPQTGSLDLSSILKQLKKKFGIQSVMVEGGANILSAFYAEQDLIDCLCITISPKLLLWRGLASIDARETTFKTDTFIDDEKMESLRFLLLGRDSIFLAKLNTVDP